MSISFFGLPDDEAKARPEGGDYPASGFAAVPAGAWPRGKGGFGW